MLHFFLFYLKFSFSFEDTIVSDKANLISIPANETHLTLVLKYYFSFKFE